MKTLTTLLNLLGWRSPKQRRSSANRSAGQKAAWAKRKAKEVPQDIQ